MNTFVKVFNLILIVVSLNTCNGKDIEKVPVQEGSTSNTSEAMSGEKNEALLQELSIPIRGYINDDRVRIRDGSGLETGTLGYINRGDEVTIIGKSKEKQKIEEMYEYWLQVKTADGLEGWVYGAYVNENTESVGKIEVGSIISGVIPMSVFIPEEYDYPLSWYEGMWVGPDSFADLGPVGYLKVEKINDEYTAEFMHFGELGHGRIYKDGKNVMMETNTWISKISITRSIFYFDDKSLFIPDFPYQREEIIKEVKKNDWWDRRTDDQEFMEMIRKKYN